MTSPGNRSSVGDLDVRTKSAREVSSTCRRERERQPVGARTVPRAARCSHRERPLSREAAVTVRDQEIGPGGRHRAARTTVERIVRRRFPPITVPSVVEQCGGMGVVGQLGHPQPTCDASLCCTGGGEARRLRRRVRRVRPALERLPRMGQIRVVGAQRPQMTPRATIASATRVYPARLAPVT